MNPKDLLSQRGQSAVEFSITLVLFLVMFFALGDFVRLGYHWFGLQYASNRGIRTVKWMPTAMDSASKQTLIKTEIMRAANAVGIKMEEQEANNIDIMMDNDTVMVETSKDVKLNPLAGLLLSFGGDNSGTYNIKVREVVYNGEL